MRKLFAFALALILVLSLLVPAMAESEAVTLRFQRIGNDEAEATFWKSVIADFMAENPDIVIEYDDAAIGEAMDTKLNNLFAANAGPDIIGHGILSVAQRVELGHYQPIDAYFDTWEGKDDIMDSVLANGTYKGHVYGLGYSVTPYVFAYRTDLLEEAGVSVPTTWEELADAARKLTVKDENGAISQSGFCFPMKGGNMVEFDVFVFGNGGKFMDDDSNPTIDTEAALGAFEFLNGLLPDVNIPYDSSETNPFVKGLAAMTLINNVALKSMLADPAYEGKVGIALPPNNGVAGNFSGCNMLFIGRDCAHPEEAFRFIAYALSNDVVLRRAQELNIPVVRDSLVAAYMEMDPYNAARAECVANGTGMPRATWSTQFQTIRNNMVQSVLFGGEDAATALAKAQEDLEFEIAG